MSFAQAQGDLQNEDSAYYCNRENIQGEEFWPALNAVCKERRPFGPLMLLGDFNAQLRWRQEAAQGCGCGTAAARGQCQRKPGSRTRAEYCFEDDVCGKKLPHVKPWLTLASDTFLQ